MDVEETQRRHLQRLFLQWLRAQRRREDPVGDVARLIERWERRRDRPIDTYAEFDRAISYEARRRRQVREARNQTVSEFWSCLRAAT